MNPKILLLMGEDEYYSITQLHTKEESPPYTFVRYRGSFDHKDVRAYIPQHSTEFDAIAVFSLSKYSGIREAMEQAFHGHKILLHTIYNSDVNRNHYIFETNLPIRPTEFDALVKQHFENLKA